MATVTGSCLFTVAATLAVPTSASALGCTDWTPALRAATVNQGLGTYTVLVRGKTTLARLFLTEPSCALPGSEQVVSASITAFDGATTIGSATTVPAALGPNYPALDSYSNGPSNTNPANVLFQLPAFAAQDATTGDLAATFAASLTYRYSTIPGSWTTATATYPVSALPTVKVGPKPNALRLLVVPMGDAAAAFSSQFPEARNGGAAINNEYADTVVQNSMQTLSRLLPLSDGVGDLTSTTAGLRYTLDDNAMIDLGQHGLKDMNWTASPAVPFCGTSSKFATSVTSTTTTQSTIAGQLSSFLSTWNSNNKSAQADRVIGVVWQGISQGVASGCDEGRALVNGTAAYIRLFADTTVTSTTGNTPDPSESGALLGMETSHTWGAVPNTDPRTQPLQDNHSANTTADPTNTQLGYNTSVAQWMSSPVSTMHYSGNTTGYANPSSGTASGWNDTTALMEAPDYLYTQCALTPTIPSGDCPAGVGTGTVGSAKAGGSIVLAGTTDGTRAGTFVHSYYATVEQSQPDPSSSYYLALSGPSGFTATPVHVGFGESEHDGSSNLVTPTIGVINAAMDAGDATAFALWKGQPPTGTVCTPQNITLLPNCLYARTLQTPPAIVSYNSTSSLAGTADFTNAAGDESGSALSPDGKLLAWVDNGSVYVAQRDPQTNLRAAGTVVSAPLPGGDPAWSPSGDSLAFVVNGDVDTVSISTGGGQPTFSNQQTVYNHLLQTPPPLGSSTASHPTWSPDGSFLVAAINGDLWEFASASSSTNFVVCDLAKLGATLTCVPMATDGDDAQPAWGGSNQLLAYTHGGALWTRDPATSGGDPVQRVVGAGSPSWGGAVIAYTRGGNVYLTNSTIEDPGTRQWPNETQLTTSGQDTAAALAATGTALAWSRPTTANGQDVFDANIVQDQSSPLRFTAATTGDPAQLEADLYITCAGANHPIVVALRSTATHQNAFTSNGVTFNTADFSTTYDDTMACPNGSIYALVTDGFLQSSPTLLRTVPGSLPGSAGPRRPSAAIAAPRPGSVYLQYDAVIAIGSSIDQSSATNTSGIRTCWTLTGPAGSGFVNTPVGSCATTTELDAPIPSGWTPGKYTLSTTVTDANGLASTASTTFTVLADPNHLGSNVTVMFNPNTLYVPSNGNDVTVTVTSQGVDLKAIDAATVRISRIGSFPASQLVDTSSGTNGWVRNSDGSYTAKFNRATLTCAISNDNLTGLYVPIVITGSGGGLTIAGLDPKNPLTSPASTPISC